jgi:hypothetical protein
VTLFVVLAVTSLSSVAMSAPHRDRLLVLADQCGETFVSEWDQYMAAITWVEKGDGAMPLALSAECETNSNGLTASRAGLSRESDVSFAQYQAAIEAAEKGWTVDPVLTGVNSGDVFAQYQAAIELGEKAWTLEPFFALDENSAEHFAQYQSAIKLGEKAWTVEPIVIREDSKTSFEQYYAAIRATELGWTVAPVLTGVNSGDVFAQYQAAIDGNIPTGGDRMDPFTQGLVLSK